MGCGKQSKEIAVSPQKSNEKNTPKNQSTQSNLDSKKNPLNEKPKKPKQEQQIDFGKSFVDTMFEAREKQQQKKQIIKETFIYEEKEIQFKSDFIKQEKPQEIIIKQTKQEQVADEESQILYSQGINLTADQIKESQQANFLIQGRFKTKIDYQKFSLSLPTNSEEILIDAIKRILKQFPFLVYQDLIITQCGKEIPFVKSGGYLYNPKFPSFGIIINFAKKDPTACNLNSLESQGFTPMQLYETGKNPKELMFSKLFAAQQKYLQQYNEIQSKLQAKSLKELLENEQFIQLIETEKNYEKTQSEFENKCLQGINSVLNGEIETAIKLDQIYSNEFEQYIFDDDIVIIMLKTFYDGNLKQLKKICSITKLISLLPGNDKIFPPQISIFKKFDNCYFVCYTLVPITRRDQIYGSDEQSLLINSNLDQSLSGNEMKSLSDYWNSLGNLFNFQELILYEKCSNHKRHCKLPLGTCIYKNKFHEGDFMPKYFILNFQNFIYPINNTKQMIEYYLLSETNFQLKDGIYYQTLKGLLPTGKNVQKKQINLIMDEYHKHKEEKNLIKEYFDNDLMSLSSSVMTENQTQSANSLQIEINEEGLKALFNNKKFKLQHQSSLPIILHLYGIGVKNLGNIFQIAPTEIKVFIMAEILARTFKNQVINYQILEEEEFSNNNEEMIQKLKNQIKNLVSKFLTKQFNDDENLFFLNECKNLFSIELSYQELSSYQLQVETITERVMQLISQKLTYYSQKMMLLRSSAINKLTKLIISQYLGKESPNAANEIDENKNELASIIGNENF